jgi:hypothetical protein
VGQEQRSVGARFILALEAGHVPPELLAELASAVLEIDAGRLAAEVRAGGPGVMLKARRLAELLMAGNQSAAVLNETSP